MRTVDAVSMDEKRREDGFTLIELLVTVLVVAILAAIAVPAFARQREKGWVAQVQASLRHAALAEQIVLASTGTYTADPVVLANQGGWRTASPVTLTAGTTVGGISYCLEVTHASLRADHDWKIAHYSSALGTFGEGHCPGNAVNGNGNGGNGNGGNGNGNGNGGANQGGRNN